MEPAEIEKSVGDLEVAVDRLRSLYEQYFMGIEKLEPTVPRKDVDRRIYALRKEQIRNTAQRFRFQMILQRYNVYQTHWQRICREIENGTYKRHLLRAERRFGDDLQPRKRPSAYPAANAKPSLDLARELAELDEEFAPAREEQLDAPGPASAQPRRGPVWRKVDPAPPRHSSPPPPLATASRPQTAPVAPMAPAPAPAPARAPAPAPLRAAAPAPAPARAGAPAPPPAARAPGGEDLPEARVRQIYAQYVDAKRKGNESTAAITYEAVAKSLRESSAKLREKHGKSVDFEVAVKDGKAILKPVIK